MSVVDFVWFELEIWIDSNSDGIIDDGEFYLFSELNIVVLNIGYSVIVVGSSFDFYGNDY